MLKLGAIQGAGQRSYLAVQGSFDLPEYMGQPRHVHAGSVRRVTVAARCASARYCGSPNPPAIPPRAQTIPRRRNAPEYGALWKHARAPRSTWRAGFLHPRGHRNLLRHRLGSALQLEPHRRAPDRPEAAVGAQRWRRSRPASFPTSTTTPTPVGGGRLHRRHAGDPRARWPEPRRLRVSGDHQPR